MPALPSERAIGARGALPALAVALLIVLFGAALRVQLAFRDAGFDQVDPRGMLRSDPAELAYLAQRVVQGGAPPLGADPRIAWPAVTDAWREFTVGQEFLVAAAARLAPDAPLHVVATVVAALTAALAALALYLLTVELTRSRRAGWLAALVYSVLPAAYRTVGLVWMREDLSLPLLAAAAWAAARAARSGRSSSAALAGALGAAAAATWHGAGVGLNALALAVVAACLTERLGPGRRPERQRQLLVGVAAFALVALLAPAARAKGVALSPPASLACAAALAVGAQPQRRAARIAAAGALLALFALARRAVVGDDLDHVGALLAAKLEHGGVLPADPARLAPDVRLMWQGPFEGLALTQLLGLLGAPLVAALLWTSAVLAAAAVWRSVEPQKVAVVAALLATAGLAVLAERAAAFAALAVPVAFVCAARGMARSGSPGLGRGAAVALAGLQALLWAGFVSRHTVPWYRPLAALEERRALVALVADTVPPGAPVLTDFLLGPALLADHGRPIVLQPKWETAAARARVHRFLECLFHAGSETFEAYLRDEAQCEWVLLDGRTLVDLRALRYAAGLPRDADPLRPGSALAALLGPAEALPAGFEVVAERGPARLLRRTR